ncbi:MAG: valine--tRNA ligase [Holosporaceae bacterium]|jgi:valyl-tRNA synthetase|nr:valine--tRNA ligase [Holosporaceae bacterium]
MLEKNFNPKSFENGFLFEEEVSLRKPKAKPFMILLPPPNVTGSLHMGHALCYTLQDIVARYKRLRGYDVLFQPGLDHAGIVMQLLVEKQLYDKGIKKGTLTRESLIREILLYKENFGGAILDQMKVLGISCDFSRLRFTMDDDSKKAVNKMFVKLFNDGLIYRGRKIVHWDPLLKSAVSDLEVVEKEIDGSLWYIKYMLADSSGHIVVATTRPETLFGDVAVAVNPNDDRYKHLIGKEVIVPLTDRTVRVIADAYADPEKGTGAVKITPAHDFNDYEVGIRNKLPIIEIIDTSGALNENVPELFQHMDRFEARRKVVELLRIEGLLEKVEQIRQKVPFGDRSDAILEPLITKQWFVDAQTLAAPAIQAVAECKTRFIPKRWENLYFDWLKNIRPWCISRQIWWGHRIPAWYGPDGRIFVAESVEEAHVNATKFYGKDSVPLIQDDDVLDTWFSSGMWPFITLGWPDDTAELKRFYSRMIVVTGFDIVFFWIARMMMMSVYCLKETPFSNVYIHGLVRDEKGQKMSKSKGNIINPLDLCRKYGADAVRYTLASLSSPGRDIKLSEQLVEVGRNFLTKLWNTVRFAQMNGCICNRKFSVNSVSHPMAKWIIYQIKQMTLHVENSMENYRFDEASSCIHHCIWHSFCDWYMEFIKPVLQSSSSDDGSDQLKNEVRNVTAWVILQFIIVLYPISPFIAKKLLSEIGAEEMSWPSIADANIDFSDAIAEVEFLKAVISAVRSTKQCLRFSPVEKVSICVESNDSHVDLIYKYGETLCRMAGVSLGKVLGKAVPVVVNNAVIHIAVGDKIDVKKEATRLRAEVMKLSKYRNDTLLRLSNSDFLRKAGENVIQEHKKRVSDISERIQKIELVVQGLETT